MSSFVIDASVAIKWLINEPGSDQALRLQQHTVSAPDLLISECANILWKKVHLGEITAEEASLAVKLIIRAGIELVQADRVAERALEMAILLDHSVYDCIYLALAEMTMRPFVTADAGLLRKLAAERNAFSRTRTIDLAVFEG